MSDRGRDGGDHLFLVDRLLEEVDRVVALLEGVHRRVGVAGDEDDLLGRHAEPSGMLVDCGARCSRHLPVAEDGVEVLGTLDGVQAIIAVGAGDHSYISHELLHVLEDDP